MRERHRQERASLLVSAYGAEQARRDQLGTRAVNPHRRAHDARARATLTRAEADELRGLPTGDAARRIKATRAEQEQTRRRAAERARQLHPFEHDPHRSEPGRDGPSLSR